MKIYTGPLNKETTLKIKRNKNRLVGLSKPSGLSRATTKTTTIDETISQYNPGITKLEIQAWVWYRKSQGIPMNSWGSYDIKITESVKRTMVLKGVLFLDPITKTLVPYPVFVFGNLYERIAKMINVEDTLTTSYGSSVYKNHISILEALKPNPLSISNPVAGERPVILAISEQARTLSVASLREDSGAILREPETLQDAFKEWIKQQPPENIVKTTAYEIINYYLVGENKPRSIEKIEWQAIKKRTRDEGERLFKIFLHEALETTDQLRIDAIYNSKYNATAPLQFNKIPIGLEISRYINGFDLKIKPAQREGIAFMELVGSGIVAFDVGVGKTITAICEMAAAIKNGKCKRPLVVVPNPTYKNWIKEMFGEGDLQGVLTGTGITLNDWYNLGVDYDGVNLDKKVPKGSITLVSYEGLNKIGFNEYTQADHFGKLSEILGQSDQSDRDREKDNEKFREIIGVGIKDTIADIETLGIDYVVVDEAHNFKNVFTSVKSEKGQNKQFQITGGSPSARGIKLFFLCNYVQRKYGRNIMLLTATPFTNSPLEIYSMLSFVAYDYMVKNNILNIRQFFELYIQETTEVVVGVDGEIKEKNVVKSFNNRISLQKLINSHINFKTGDEANIPRPCKVNIPKTTKQTDDGVKKLKRDNQILSYLQLNDAQAHHQSMINEAASKGADRNDPGKLLRLMSESLNNALTPFLYGGAPKDYIDFVENSPKIKYAIECIREVKKWHEKRKQPVSGQVIYIDRGKQFFPLIKEYLEKELGYGRGKTLKSNPRLKVDEVEFVMGGMSSSKKEKIKDAFNEGVCKIIIGTSTIKEGINLQKKATTLYNLYPNWNPTDIRQLEGRIWRQKNEFGYVRIVMPLMENSMDVFVFQKLDEKTSRINDLWSKSDRGNVLDEESLDPNAVKFALVTDINVLLRYEKSQIVGDLKAKEQILSSRLESIKTYDELKASYQAKKQEAIDKILSAYNGFGSEEVHFNKNTYQRLYFRDVPTYDVQNGTKDVEAKIERANKIYEMLGKASQGLLDDKTIIQTLSAYHRFEGSTYGTMYAYNKFRDVVSQFGKLQKSLFSNRGYDENTNISKIQADLEKELEETIADIEDTSTDEFHDKLYKRIAKEKDRLAIKGGNLASRVKDFASLNHLLSYKFSDIDPRSCFIPTTENKSVPARSKNDDILLEIAEAEAEAAFAMLILNSL